MGRRKKQPDPFGFHLETVDIAREKQKARDLRASQWWKRQCARGQCHYCGVATPPQDLTMDHVVPLARGGRSTKGNVVPCCKDCNSHKKQLLPMEWDRYLAGDKNNGPNRPLGPTAVLQLTGNPPFLIDVNSFSGHEPTRTDEAAHNASGQNTI